LQPTVDTITDAIFAFNDATQEQKRKLMTDTSDDYTKGFRAGLTRRANQYERLDKKLITLMKMTGLLFCVITFLLIAIAITPCP
jgi:hypothetical protein